MDKKQKSFSIPGTKVSVQNAQLLISSGIVSLDEIIGGGFPVGTVILVQEDANCNYAKFLLKYFLAEGAASKHSLYVASKDASTKQIMRELPCTVKEEIKEVENFSTEEMKIAFMYERYKNINASANISPIAEFGHHFDLGTYMSPNDIANVDVEHWNDSTGNYNELLQSIYEKINSLGLFLTNPSQKRSVFRLGILSLGSPSWKTDNFAQDDADLRKFMLSLRALMRASYSVALITVPTKLMDKKTISKCCNCCDVCLRLSSFSGTELESNASLQKYHGFFYVDKIAAINSLASKHQGPVDYAFKLLRRKFCIETLHLPPELQESTEREQDDSVPGMGCGSSRKHLLEF